MRFCFVLHCIHLARSNVQGLVYITRDVEQKRQARNLFKLSLRCTQNEKVIQRVRVAYKTLILARYRSLCSVW